MKDKTIAVIGLGYVGLPLAVAFGEKFKTFGYDINENRIEQLKKYYDKTEEVSPEEIKKAKFLTFTWSISDIKNANIYIITVPTPIDIHKMPDLSAIKSATETVGKVLKKGDIVIYESTVYPGCTEEDCVPILEKISGLKYNVDFFCGYSPERINPGDKNHRLKNIIKVVSGSTPEITEEIAKLYETIIDAGVFKAKSIKVAEAAKVIENTQRDLNIALINELALIFDKLGINTKDVLEAAATKWNFLKFEPGLVGGHCIGVDPYYLTFKAQAIGYHPEVILAGRKINDEMGRYIAEKTVKLMIKSSKTIKGSSTLIAGFTFKENCPDVRNTKVIDIYNELIDFGVKVDIFDPYADRSEAKKYYNVEVKHKLPEKKYDAIIIAVKHDIFFNTFSPEKIAKLINDKGILVDVKSIFHGKSFPENIIYWNL